MKNKECTAGPSYCQICGKKMPHSDLCVDCYDNLETKKKKNLNNK